MKHLREGRCSAVFRRGRPQRFPAAEKGVVTAMSSGVNKFVMQHKSGILPPRWDEQVWMKVNDADVLGPQAIEPDASHPTRDTMTADRPLTKDAQRDASEDGEIRSLPRFHRTHALEHLVLQRLQEQGLLRRWAQNTTPQDQRW